MSEIVTEQVTDWLAGWPADAAKLLQSHVMACALGFVPMHHSKPCSLSSSPLMPQFPLVLSSRLTHLSTPFLLISLPPSLPPPSLPPRQRLRARSTRTCSFLAGARPTCRSFAAAAPSLRWPWGPWGRRGGAER